MAAEENKVAIEILNQTLNENPELWETRKKTAKLLYEDGQYAEAADIIWNAPEIPSSDIDIAFVLKMISRVKPNRSIRLIYEVVRRNKDKPQKNMAVAKALNDIGMYMEAARFYGAALAMNSALLDLDFERQVLWLDDTGRLIEEWKKSEAGKPEPLNVPSQNISGGLITPSALPNNLEGHMITDPPPSLPSGIAPTPPTGNPGLAEQHATHNQPLAPNSAPMAPVRPANLQPQTLQPPATPHLANPPQQMSTQPLMVNPTAVAQGTVQTQPLMVPAPTQPLTAYPAQQPMSNPQLPPQQPQLQQPHMQQQPPLPHNPYAQQPAPGQQPNPPQLGPPQPRLASPPQTGKPKFKLS